MGVGWFLGVRTEGADEFSRELRGLKAVRSEFAGFKVLNFLENLRGGLRQTSRNQHEYHDFSACKLAVRKGLHTTKRRGSPIQTQIHCEWYKVMYYRCLSRKIA